MKRPCGVFILLLLVVCRLPGQHRFTGFALPKIIYNAALNDRLNWTVNLESELVWLEKTGENRSSLMWRPDEVTAEIGLDYRLTTRLDLAGAYQLGWSDLREDTIDLQHRFQQQLTGTARWGKARLRGRLRAEQRLARGNDYRLDHRLRYRQSIDLPLQGERLDSREAYLNATAEWVIGLSDVQPLRYQETRLYAGIGWRLVAGPRLENGLEWRTRLADPAGYRNRALFWRVTFTI